jgi:PIN domain nuclease of toxin-antitoxin system
MRLLLDTHVFLWCLQDSPRLAVQPPSEPRRSTTATPDRLPIAQAHAEGLRMVTADPVFDRYGVAVIDAAT